MGVLDDESHSDKDLDGPDDFNGWNTTLKVLEKFGEQYGRWQNYECIDMKKKLLAMDELGNGRVTLKRFYGQGVSDLSTWMFRETSDYLRMLGVLDETDPADVSVIIPNYINSASN